MSYFYALRRMNNAKKVLLVVLLIGFFSLQRFLMVYSPRLFQLVSIVFYALVVIVLIVVVINWRKDGHS